MVHTTDMMICCSFAKKAGNFGMRFHNTAAEKLGLDFLYKSFSVDDIGKAVEAMRTLNFRGAAVSMPFKVEVLKHVDYVSAIAQDIGSANTILNENGKLTAYNTDWLAAEHMLDLVSEETGLKELVILGDGGYAKSIQYAARAMLMPFTSVTRREWSDIGQHRGKIIFNCTPVERVSVDASNVYIDCIVGTETGNRLAKWQAEFQFQLWTGQKAPEV